MSKPRQFRVVYYPNYTYRGFYYVEEKTWWGWREVYGTATRSKTEQGAMDKFRQCKSRPQVAREWTE